MPCGDKLSEFNSADTYSSTTRPSRSASDRVNHVIERESFIIMDRQAFLIERSAFPGDPSFPAKFAPTPTREKYDNSPKKYRRMTAGEATEARVRRSKPLASSQIDMSDQ
jgi:hypothetical protein